MSNLQINMGKEFYNANIQILLKKIQYKSLFNIFHNESINRQTITIMLTNDVWKQFTHNVNYKWIDLLPRLVEIPCAKALNSVCSPQIWLPRRQTLKYNSVKAVTFQRFKVGDSVRVSKFKMIFKKGYKLDHGDV